MYYYFAITGLVNGLASIILGSFVYLKNRTSEINKKFAFFNIWVFAWSFGYIFWPLSQNNLNECLFWFRFLHIGAVLVPPAFLDFVVTFLGINRHKVVRVGYILALLVISFIFTPIFLQNSMKPVSIFKLWAIPGPMFYPYLVMFFGYAGYSSVLLFNGYKHSVGAKRNQIFIMFVCSLVGYVGACVSNYLLFFGFSVPPYANISILIYLIFFSYAIVAHNLFNIEIIVRRTIVFGGLLVSVLTMLVLPTLIIQEYIVRNAGFVGRAIGLSISGIMIIFGVKKIELFLVNVTDKYLFQKKYDYRELVKVFARDVLTVVELDKLLLMTAERISEIVRLKSCTLFLHNEERKGYDLQAHVGNVPTMNFVVDEDIQAIKAYVLRSETADKKAADLLERLDANLLIPVRFKDSPIALVSLGAKMSDEDFTKDDLDIILPLSRTLAIAISNAKLFAELARAQKEMAEKEKMAVIGTLAAGMAHEIRNPVSTIKIFTEYVPDRIGEFEFRNKYRDIVIKEVEKINHVIQALVDFSAEEQAAESEEIRLRSAIEDLILIVGAKQESEKRITFINSIQEGIPLIKMNRKDLDEILLNLTQNAIQAISREGKIEFNATEKEASMVLEIIDNGCGMNEDVLRHIFAPFFTTKSKGFGLGLFVVSELVRRNGGKISVESVVGAGTKFTLEFQKQKQNISN